MLKTFGLITVYSFNLVLKLCFTALLEGICATSNLCLQALKQYLYYYIDIYLKDITFALYWGARKEGKLNACKKIQLYSNGFKRLNSISGLAR